MSAGTRQSMALHQTRRFFEKWSGHRSDHNPAQAVLKAQSQFHPKTKFRSSVAMPGIADPSHTPIARHDEATVLELVSERNVLTCTTIRRLKYLISRACLPPKLFPCSLSFGPWSWFPRFPSFCCSPPGPPAQQPSEPSQIVKHWPPVRRTSHSATFNWAIALRNLKP